MSKTVAWQIKIGSVETTSVVDLLAPEGNVSSLTVAAMETALEVHSIKNSHQRMCDYFSFQQIKIGVPTACLKFQYFRCLR